MKVSTALQSVHRLFLDSSAVIYYIDENPAYLPVMDLIFDQVDANLIRAVTSPVTLAECLVLPIRDQDALKQQIFIDIITLPEMADFIPSGREVAQQAAVMRVRYNLKLPDALQIATAIAANCDAFLTNDEQLKRVQELNVIVIKELEP